MADNDKRKLDIPWATLLPLAAVLAGIIADMMFSIQSKWDSKNPATADRTERRINADVFSFRYERRKRRQPRSHIRHAVGQRRQREIARISENALATNS